MPVNQQAKNWVTIADGVINPDNQGESSLILHKGYKKEYVWNAGEPWATSLSSQVCE